MLAMPHLHSTTIIDADPEMAPEVDWLFNNCDGTNGLLPALAEAPNGDIYIAGPTLVNGVQVSRIAKWDGTQWSDVGTGLNDITWSLAIGPDGNLYAGGAFTEAGGQPANYVAMWDGTNWYALGNGTVGVVETIGFSHAGVLYAGGYDVAPDGSNAGFVAKFENGAWQNIGAGMNEWVHYLTFTSTDDLIVGGRFTMVDNQPHTYIARWDGIAWHSIGGGVNSDVKTILVDENDHIYAGGGFTQAGGVPAVRIAKWDGNTWSALGEGVNSTLVYLDFFEGNLIAGGNFNLSGTTTISHIAKWENNQWSSIGAGTDGPVMDGIVTVSGDLMVGGLFNSAGSTVTKNIAIWKDNQWSGVCKQCTCFGPVTLTTQAEVDAFCCFGAFSGNLTIGPSADITDLSPLNGITSVSGVLRIDQNAALQTLDGLQSITSGHGIVISANDQLLDMEGLNNLDYVTLNFALIDNPILSDISALGNLHLIGNASLNVLNNDALANLVGLGGVTYGTAITIENNDGLIDLTGLNNLTGAGSWLRIFNNGLVTLTGLENFQSVDNALRIGYNDNLINVDALANLTYIGQDLWVGYNASLQDVDGFSGVTAVNNLSIVYNSSLTNVDGFENVQSVLDGLYLINNASLTSCCGIYTALNNGPLSPNISGNPGCASVSEVLSNCAPVLDEDGDGYTIDDGDCDDANAAIFPGAIEKCNGIDDDCDGEVDEDLGTSPAQIVISSQAELDAIPAYTVINGNLNIIGTDVHDLSPLACLTTINNGLHIYDNPNLTSLDGLESLTSVKGITIRDNENLVDISGLSNLSSVGTDGVKFVNNDALTGISLPSVSNIAFSATKESINISEHNQLQSISFTSLTEVSSRLFIVNNYNINTLDFPNVTSIGKFDFINSSMISLTGFPLLTNIGLDLSLVGHPFLQDFGDFSKVQVDGGVYLNGLGVQSLSGLTSNIQMTTLQVNGCNNLTDISRLASLNSITDLSITRNSSLQDCCPIAELINNGISIVTIELNDVFCNSVEEILTTCLDQDGDGFTTDDGDCDDSNVGVYPGAEEICNGIDDDCDGLVDEDETPPTALCASSGQVVIDFDEYYTNDNQRHFYRTISEDGFTISQNIPAAFNQDQDILVFHGDQSGFWWKGSTALWLTLASNPATYAELTKDDGGLFDVQSVSVATQIGSSVPQNFTMEGVKSDGTVVSQSFVSQSATSLVPFTLNADFTELTIFRWATASDGAFQVDDIVISTGEPIELALDEQGQATLTAQEIDAGSYDNCSVVSLSTNKTLFTCEDLNLSEVGGMSSDVILTVTDDAGNSSSCIVPVTIIDTLVPVPQVTTLPIQSGCEVTVSEIPLAIDNCGGNIVGLTADPLFYDLPGTYTIKWSFTDASGNTSEQIQQVIIEDQLSPTIDEILIDADPIQLGQSHTTEATFSDACDFDDHVAVWHWGDGTSSAGLVDQDVNSISGTHNYSEAGVYVVELQLEDGAGNYTSLIATTYAVVYNPEGGFVTGGGWIQSPEGALLSDPSAVGKANFGFVSKYQNGANVPTGNTSFKFNAGNFKFKSTEYDWLVVAGARAKFKGSGTVNNQGDFGFQVTGIDGQVNGGGGIDQFRIKIWDKLDDQVIYDNKLGTDDTSYDAQEIGGGSVTVHNEGSSSKLPRVTGTIDDGPSMEVFPNPTKGAVSIRFSLPVNVSEANFEIIDINGRVVWSVAVENEGLKELSWDGAIKNGDMAPAGMYFVILYSGSEILHKRLVKL